MTSPPKAANYGKIGTFLSVVFTYWLLFFFVLLIVTKVGSGDVNAEQMNTLMMAPFILPFTWIVQFLNDKMFGYILLGIFIIWMVQKEIERLHNKLDQIIEAIRGQKYWGLQEIEWVD